jgi:hypothetical protein
MKAKTTLYILLFDSTWIVRTSHERRRCVCVCVCVVSLRVHGCGSAFRSTVYFNVSKMVDNFQNYIFIIYLYFSTLCIKYCEYLWGEGNITARLRVNDPSYKSSRHLSAVRLDTVFAISQPRCQMCILFANTIPLPTAFSAEIARFRIWSCEDHITCYILAPDLGVCYVRRRRGWRPLNRSFTIALFHISIQLCDNH